MTVNHSRARALLLLAATFAAGVMVGVGGRAVWARAAREHGPERARGVDRLMAELTAELRLTPAQQDSVHGILERHWTRMAALWEAVRPRFDSMRTQLDSEVVRQLTREQQAGYRDHMARHRHHKQKTDSSKGGGGGGSER